MPDISVKRLKKSLFPDNAFFYLLTLLLFPISFILHGNNEHYGLIELPVIFKLLFLYTMITIAVAFFSKILLGSYSKAMFFSFVILIIYFLFGVFKDFTRTTIYLQKFSKYSFLLPALSLFVILFAMWLKKSTKSFGSARIFIEAFLLLSLLFEISLGIFNLITKREADIDLGDVSQELAKAYTPFSKNRPKIFWLVFDEYPASNTLKKVWQFHNPLDSILTAKGFFVASNASSNYNYTHYSLSSTLDMVYLTGLANHSIVTPRHMVRGLKSLYETNVLKILKESGYAIKNYTFYDVKDHPAKGQVMFKNLPESLIHFQTFGERVKADIGWNFSSLLEGNDSLANVRQVNNIDRIHKAVIRRNLEAVSRGNVAKSAEFFMFHFMLPHEPFIYTGDGTIPYKKNVFEDLKEDFIPHLSYTNSVVAMFADSIISRYKNDNIVIIIQGDHGFKFEESDPFFEEESCNILYAVYCSDKDYRGWYDSISSVNSFRIIFNKYLQTDFPLLKDTSYNLLYRGR